MKENNSVWNNALEGLSNQLILFVVLALVAVVLCMVFGLPLSSIKDHLAFLM